MICIVFRSSLSLGQIGKVIICLSVFQVRFPSSSAEGAPVTVMCHGGSTAPTWAAVFNPSLDSVTAVVLLLSFCLSPVLSLGYSASRTWHTKPASGGNEDRIDGTDLLSFPLQHTKTLFRPSGHTSNCWCGDACADKLFLENNQLGSNLASWCQIATCASIAGNTGFLTLLTSPQGSSIFACYYQIGLVNVVYSTPELSPLNVRWEHWLCILAHMRFTHRLLDECLTCVLSYAAKQKRKYDFKLITFTDSFKM